MGDTKTYVYKFIYDEKNNDDMKIIKYFIIHELGLCINVDSYVARMFYAWSFSHNTAVPIYINNNKYLLSLHSHTTVFAEGDIHLNKNRT